MMYTIPLAGKEYQKQIKDLQAEAARKAKVGTLGFELFYGCYL